MSQIKWEEYWSHTKDIGESSFYGRWLRNQRLKILEEILSSFPRTWSVIDTGCGSGKLLKLVRSLGFQTAIGIDISDSALNECEINGFVKGRDVFPEDVTQASFSDKAFDVVIAEGLWEHFVDCRRVLAEASRLSRNYIISMIPNHFSFTGAALKFGGLIFKKTMRELKEHSHPLSYYTKILNQHSFELVSTRFTLLHEQVWLIYRRTNNG